MGSLAVWLDTNQAFILDEKGEILELLRSGVATREREPGQGSDQAKMGHQFLDPERKKEERYRHELNHYFREISELIEDYSPLLLFGPGPIKKIYYHYLLDDKRFRNTEIVVETADTMSKNQLGAYVRSFFASSKKV